MLAGHCPGVRRGAGRAVAGGEDPGFPAPTDRGKEKAIKEEAEARCDYRRTEEAKLGVEILERIKVLGQTNK